MSLRRCPPWSARAAVRYIVPALIAAVLLPGASGTVAASRAQPRVPALQLGGLQERFRVHHGCGSSGL